MRGWLAVALIFLPGLAWADTDTAEKPTTHVDECQVCTARHKSLQALQAARVPPKPEAETTNPDEEKTDD
ncbi:MAG: hypothetical protein AAFW87_01765 [Pseudomonadota bacterium]